MKWTPFEIVFSTMILVLFIISIIASSGDGILLSIIMYIVVMGLRHMFLNL